SRRLRMQHPSVHDALFKATFSRIEHAVSELRQILPPEVAARVDWATLALAPGSFIDEVLQWSSSDLLFTASLDGREGLIYVLFEHQSTVDPLMVYRTLRYAVRIWDAWLANHQDAKRIPPILPVILHHSAAGWTAPTRFEDVLDVDGETLAALGDLVPRFRIVLDDISLATDESLKARAITAFARLVLLCLRHVRVRKAVLERL